MMGTIKVSEVMSGSPIMVSKNLSVEEAAKIMTGENVDFLLVSHDENLVGIVTERDIIRKVIAEGKNPKEVRLADIMSTPIIVIPGSEPLEKAARIMARHEIRRLPVIEGHRITGVLTQEDIVRISPELIEITKEYSRMEVHEREREVTEEYVAGRCEGCGQYSLMLKMHNDLLLCPECREE